MRANRTHRAVRTAPRLSRCHAMEWTGQWLDLGADIWQGCPGTFPSQGKRRARGHGPLFRKSCRGRGDLCAGSTHWAVRIAPHVSRCHAMEWTGLGVTCATCQNKNKVGIMSYHHNGGNRAAPRVKRSVRSKSQKRVVATPPSTPCTACSPSQLVRRHTGHATSVAPPHRT